MVYDSKEEFSVQGLQNLHRTDDLASLTPREEPSPKEIEKTPHQPFSLMKNSWLLRIDSVFCWIRAYERNGPCFKKMPLMEIRDKYLCCLHKLSGMVQMVRDFALQMGMIQKMIEVLNPNPCSITI